MLECPDTPLVSIITPTYNHQAFIGACIDSALGQSYKNWEQIVVDDGSTDRTAEIVRSYRDKRIRYIYQQNAGIEALAHTYNRALSLSQGELIAILEGDDFWPTNKLSKLIPAFQDSSVVLAYGEMHEVALDGSFAKRISRTARRRQRLSESILCNDPFPAAAPYMLTFEGHSLIPASTVVIRRSALEAIGGFQYVPQQRYVDFPTFIRLSTQGKFYYTSEIMGYRRMHSGSATALFMDEMLKTAQNFRWQLMADSSFALSDVDRTRIEESWRSYECAREFVSGRMRLLDRHWRQARSHFLSAFSTSDLRVTAGASLGWILSWARCDLEGVFRLAGRTSLKAHPY